MSKFLKGVLILGFSFGPLFMTDMGSHGSDDSAFAFVGSLIGSLMVAIGLIVMFLHMLKQDQLIKEMQSQIGNTNEQTANS